MRKIQTLALWTLLGVLSVSLFDSNVVARPVAKGKGSVQLPQKFIRQRNTLSNMDFYYTNKGVLFNNDNVAGLQWPRGTSNSYIYGGGVWFATKKIIGGKRRKLCELGYNPNSGAGWYADGEINGANDLATADSKYISYVGSRYTATEGTYDGQVRSSVPPPYYNWPIWDTSASKTLKQNFYFGDYISDINLRKSTDITTIDGQPKTTKPAMLSQEDIVNIYSDVDVSNNPEYRPNSGYPFNLNIVEIIHSWSFGRYRDMIFVRHKITNASEKDTLYECFMAPAFDPDLGTTGGAAANDRNQYVGSDPLDLTRTQRTLKGTCFENDPTLLNMAYQSSDKESGKEYGVIGFAFLQSPVTNSSGVVLDISDSLAVGGYGLQDSRRQLGLATFKKWTIANDPPTSDLRYDFLADGSKDGDGGIVADVRLLFSTGPFTIPPKKSVETCVGIGIAQVSTTTRESNIDSVFKLIAFAHSVFGGGCYTIYDSVTVDSVTTPTSKVVHFKTPIPPDLPNMTGHSLDKGVFLEWDSTADNSKDELSNKTLAFNTYELWRTTRSDLDSNVRPDGINPVIRLGKWSLYNFKTDTVKDAQGVVIGTKLTRTNTTANKIPHSFLDIGDDNNDGTLTGTEPLINGAKYYYYLIASDEFDSVNSVGPIATAIVKDKNLVTVIPAKPVFPDLPDELSTIIAPCFSGNDQTKDPKVNGMSKVAIEVVDTGKFIELYANDTILVTFQPRWTYFNQTILNQTRLDMNMDVRNSKNTLELTYEKFTNPNNTPVVTPYSFSTGLILKVEGQNADSNVAGAFSTENNLFAPYQRIDQSFKVLTDYQFTQLKAPHKLQSISVQGAEKRIVRLSQRTLPGLAGGGDVDYENIPPERVNPSYLGSLGEVEYEISFGQPEDMNVQKWDTTTLSYKTVTNVYDEASNTTFTPRPLRVTVTSVTHCDSALETARDMNNNDSQVELDYRYYTNNAPVPTQPGLFFPTFSDPDTMRVPNPGFFAIDAFYFADDDPVNHGAATQIDATTSSHYYYPGVIQSGSKYMATVHRIRLGGAEIILNYPGISNSSVTGDTTFDDGQFATDFKPGDKIRVKFTGVARGLPFPGAEFKIPTTPGDPVDFKKSSLYAMKEILDQVTVVPNPFIVSHIGQTTTDNSKLFFTRLPPRATIEIYTPDGDLVKTLEHKGYESTVDQSGNVTYNYDELANRYNVAEWNILSEGRQRVGSQVLIARVIAKDPKNGDAVIGETTVKFAVILGGYRSVK